MRGRPAPADKVPQAPNPLCGLKDGGGGGTENGRNWGSRVTDLCKVSSFDQHKYSTHEAFVKLLPCRAAGVPLCAAARRGRLFWLRHSISPSFSPFRLGQFSFEVECTGPSVRWRKREILGNLLGSLLANLVGSLLAKPFSFGENRLRRIRIPFSTRVLLLGVSQHQREVCGV